MEIIVTKGESRQKKWDFLDQDGGERVSTKWLK